MHNNDEDPNDIYAFSEDEDSSSALNPEAEKLLDRSEALLSEIEAFQRTLRRSKMENTVELRHFVTQVKSEHRHIQGLALEPPDSAKTKHGLSSTNLPYLEAVWRVAKSTSGINAFCKTFAVHDERGKAEDGKKANKRTKSSVTVDIVGQNGLQWIKVSTITPRRLLFEIAKAGWEEGEEGPYSSDEDCAYPSTSSPTGLATSTLNLTTIAATLYSAASQIRIQYLHPTVHIVLPNIDPNQPDAAPEITEFLKTLATTGVHVQCGSSADASSDAPGILSPPKPLDMMLEDISTPIRRHTKPISNPLNIDTTILLALISDISTHTSVRVEPRFHPAILRQLEMEKEQAMLPVHLFPVLAGRELVCTPSTRERFDEIVSIVASESERARAALLLDPLPWAKKKKEDEDVELLSLEERRSRFQDLCVHPLPPDLRFPIRTLPEQYQLGNDDDTENPSFRKVALKLSQVNRAVFMTGWQHGWTTISSNRTVAKMIETWLEENEEEQGEQQVVTTGPDIYVVPTARSLVGKAKRINV